jgi:hypothetical protein
MKSRYTTSFKAVLLSLLIPGLGQLTAGDERKGLHFVCIYALLCLLKLVSGAISVILSLLFLIIMLCFVIYAAYDAYKMICNTKIMTSH